MDLEALPGGAVIRQGLSDLAAGKASNEALLVTIGGPRLRRLGFTLPDAVTVNPERDLYDRLATDGSDAAHSRYNALIRLLVSFERAAESGAR